jgi:hypothetical protein
MAAIATTVGECRISGGDSMEGYCSRVTRPSGLVFGTPSRQHAKMARNATTPRMNIHIAIVLKSSDDATGPLGRIGWRCRR